MQPCPSEVSQRSSRSVSPHESNHVAQYGFFDSDARPAGQPRNVGSAGSDTAGSGAALPTGVSPQASPISDANTDDSRLTGPNLDTNASTNRVDEYERASSHQTRLRSHSGVTFQIVSRSRSNGSEGYSLLDLPNEILTHILSHLTPSALSTTAFVSRRLHDLVTTPHAWRIAFSRYFPGQQLTNGLADDGSGDTTNLTRRSFTRLTSFASWRSEYILRTRLLRSLARGRPSDALPIGGRSSARSGHNSGVAQLTFNSNLLALVNKLHANFGTGLNKRAPRFVHGAADIGCASSSDPVSHGRVDAWGSGDPQSFLQFDMRFPGDAQYGLGSGEMVGVPNSMDVSQSFGMIVGEGCPGGLVYFRHPQEQRGRFLTRSLEESLPELGIPRVDQGRETVCSVWIAKSSEFHGVTEGLISIMSGSSMGILTAYSAGTDGLAGTRLERGLVTSRWVLCPGVPIIAIAVDEKYSPRRRAQHRIWAVALNALGEVFVLCDVPERLPTPNHTDTKLSESALDMMAWAAGRTVRWELIDATRRRPQEDPYGLSQTDGSYSPRSSSDKMDISKAELIAETKEIEQFLRQQPKHLQSVCQGWDMRRCLEVDFAGDDEHGAGESIFVFDCGFDEAQGPICKRFTRSRARVSGEEHTPGYFNPSLSSLSTHQQKPEEPTDIASDPLFGAEVLQPDQWLTSELSFGYLPDCEILTVAADQSVYATLLIDEDPLLSLSASRTSSPWSTPTDDNTPLVSPAEIPGQRARFIAAGTNRGQVLVWNMRGPMAINAMVSNTLAPVRIIHTDSPQISCLAVSSLYLVHGGNDGLVQAWDPLGSQQQPIRTLNSRFSSRARRRLIQAEASPWGVGMNLFAAGAICLDPDPTSLRGMVSLGTHLRYWSYSSSAADPFKRSKRRLRRGERNSNQGADGGFTGSARGALKSYIQDERREIERETTERQKERARLEGRFGVGLLGPGATEEEMLAYATMLSHEETERSEEDRRQREKSGSAAEEHERGSEVPQASVAGEGFEREIEEAIRLSLQDNDQPYSSSPDIPIRFAKGKDRAKSSRTSPPGGAAAAAGSSRAAEADDLDFALQLSLAEERSKNEAGLSDLSEDYPVLSPASSAGSNGSRGKGKGKGKGKGRKLG